MSEKERQRQIESVAAKAKEYAVKNKTLAVLYWKSDREVDFMDAAGARAVGITPIKFVSFV